jgi:3-phenylpropionate/trans-cinnamate dioxygenase ferredoxin reductase subunit
MESYKYVVIGGGLAGERGAENARKVDPEGTVALVTAEPHMPYDRPPLSKGYLSGEQGRSVLNLRRDAFYAKKKLDVISGVWATRIEPAARRVTLDDGRVLAYEKLLLATGGRAWRLPIPGNDLPGVFTLRIIEDADAIRIATQAGKRALVIGGSFIGSEAAAALVKLGLEVTMVFPEARLLGRVVPGALSAFVQRKYEARGVRLLTGTRPERLEGDDKVERVVLDNGETLEVDLAVMGVGIRLNTELAREAGLELDEQGAVVVDETLRSSDPHIYAAGDIANWPDPTFGKRLRVEHWDVARGQGLRAGRNMAGEEKPYRTLPYFFSNLFDLSFEAWGDLSAWDQTVLRGALEGESFVLFCFYQGNMVGVLAAGRPGEERQHMPALVRARLAYEAVESRLRDKEVNLETLI